jgi:hypothetical protein
MSYFFLWKPLSKFKINYPAAAIQAPRLKRYSSYSFLTLALDGVSITPQLCFTLGKDRRYPLDISLC